MIYLIVCKYLNTSKGIGSTSILFFRKKIIQSNLVFLERFYTLNFLMYKCLYIQKYLNLILGGDIFVNGGEYI